VNEDLRTSIAAEILEAVARGSEPIPDAQALADEFERRLVLQGLFAVGLVERHPKRGIELTDRGWRALDCRRDLALIRSELDQDLDASDRVHLARAHERPALLGFVLGVLALVVLAVLAALSFRAFAWAWSSTR